MIDMRMHGCNHADIAADATEETLWIKGTCGESQKATLFPTEAQAKQIMQTITEWLAGQTKPCPVCGDEMPWDATRCAKCDG